MEPQIVATLGFAIGAFAALVGTYYWRSSLRARALLTDALEQTKKLQTQIARLNADKEKAQEKLTTLRAELKKADKTQEDLKAKIATAQDAIVQKNQEMAASERSSKLALENYTEQIETLHKQLAEAVSNAKSAQDNLQKHDAAIASQLEEAKKSAEKNLTDLRSKLRKQEKLNTDLKRENERLKETLKTANPKDLVAMKKRVAQYARLYTAMRGLREIAEERNYNWESALDKLSRWILREKKVKVADSDKVGPLVGQALQAIGEELGSDDRFSQSNQEYGNNITTSDLNPAPATDVGTPQQGQPPRDGSVVTEDIPANAPLAAEAQQAGQ